MYCEYCGKERNADGKYCPQCGRPASTGKGGEEPSLQCPQSVDVPVTVSPTVGDGQSSHGQRQESQEGMLLPQSTGAGSEEKPGDRGATPPGRSSAYLWLVLSGAAVIAAVLGLLHIGASDIAKKPGADFLPPAATARWRIYERIEDGPDEATPFELRMLSKQSAGKGNTVATFAMVNAQTQQEWSNDWRVPLSMTCEEDKLLINFYFSQSLGDEKRPFIQELDPPMVCIVPEGDSASGQRAWAGNLLLPMMLGSELPPSHANAVSYSTKGNIDVCGKQYAVVENNTRLQYTESRNQGISHGITFSFSPGYGLVQYVIEPLGSGGSPALSRKTTYSFEMIP